MTSSGLSPGSGASRIRSRALVAAAFLPLVALIIWHAIQTYWLCDDAFISFRYVRNLVDGHGFVFNRGERVEGYTNFLWVLELAGLWKLAAVRPEIGCTILSVLYSAGSIALTVVLALSGPFRERRVFAAWGALLLLAASHTWAVWTTSGLETRQFTFFVLLAVVCLQSSVLRPRLLLGASIALAAGEYTRPEGSLMFVCCLAWLLFDRIRSKSLRWRELALFCLPFVVLVGLHFAWRWTYYAEILPNTYYAKHVRAWPEAGFRYFGVAAIEFGMYVLVPAALIGTLARLRRGDATHLLALAIVIPHAAYVIQIGGDHFEFRVLDFYWPLLAVAAVEGALAVAGTLASALSRARLEPSVLARDAAAFALLLVLTLYTSAVQVAKAISTERRDTRESTQKMVVSIQGKELRALSYVPGLPLLLGHYNTLNAFLAPRGIGAPFVEHRFFWRLQTEHWAPYEATTGKGWIPPDAVTTRGSIGVFGYYLADLVLIDAKGLTDHYVARQPVERPNEQRYMAHDRTADWEYLQRRGFNMLISPAAKSAEQALETANYAMRLQDDLWMPFDSIAPAWADKAFRGGPEVRTWGVDGVIGCFTAGNTSAWTLEGDAFADQPRPETANRPKLQPYRRCPGAMVLDSRGKEAGRAATGRALSPEFEVPRGGRLEFWFGGAPVRGVGLRLKRGEERVHVWRPRSKHQLFPERWSLRDYEGEKLRIEVFDDNEDSEAFVLVADVMLLVPTVLDGP